ncbi:indole-3-glycerol-phosphate synthase TrpC, partial [Bacillus cereus]|nr:indole-3-glycerol-phosphate synthase TrpC [Bacillus cereus]
AIVLKQDVIGIHNRTLKSFEVDLRQTEKIGKRFNEEKLLWISESGIYSKEDISRVKRAGAKVVLVGEALMTSSTISSFCEDCK